ncbi:Imm1 family immunity protein [Streptoalloteichus hindustanus]|uniref:Immunity protein Imm1 n=1 Tax=Streptoalloteichus hindustanus TaxID=2017 RepID=A0A1M5GF94_STRHI|nr:Imm1 family immunity protein [Streptoalloteichus hindustanus]SHG02368.1 Immunity protein Imm1 [Streptoalloteichus hindustanus]
MAGANYTLEFGLEAATDDATIIARTVQEVDAALERVIAAASTFNHNPTAFVVERPRFGPLQFPDHGLKIDVDPRLGVAALAWVGPDFDCPWVTKSDRPVPGASLHKDIDSATPFPDDAAITLDQLRAAVHEFRESGGHRPKCVEWQEADGW